jgi:hypothetical protein
MVTHSPFLSKRVSVAIWLAGIALAIEMAILEQPYYGAVKFTEFELGEMESLDARFRVASVGLGGGSAVLKWIYMPKSGSTTAHHRKSCINRVLRNHAVL